MTKEERIFKFNEMVSLISKARRIMAELNLEADTKRNSESILSVNLESCIPVNQIHLAGYGEPEIVDIVKLDRVAERDGSVEFYTVKDDIKIFMLKWE